MCGFIFFLVLLAIISSPSLYCILRADCLALTPVSFSHTVFCIFDTLIFHFFLLFYAFVCIFFTFLPCWIKFTISERVFTAIEQPSLYRFVQRRGGIWSASALTLRSAYKRALMMAVLIVQTPFTRSSVNRTSLCVRRYRSPYGLSICTLDELHMWNI